MSKISNSVGRNDNFLSKAEKLSILPTSLDVFDIQQHFIGILYNLLSVKFQYVQVKSKNAGTGLSKNAMCGNGRKIEVCNLLSQFNPFPYNDTF